jgi:hypothetical protein
MGDMRNANKVFEGNPTVFRDHLEDIDTNGKIQSKSILKEYGGRMWSGLLWLKFGSSDEPL